MKRLAKFLAVALLGASAGLACSARPADYHEDFTAEVERLCADYCEMNLACRAPPAFANYDECEDACLGLDYVYNDTTCGEAHRAMIECIGSQPTCELFMDTYNVSADDYTCKAEKDRVTSLHCPQTDEDPTP